jgi:D-alanyl-D-alanine carboxypeptidase
VLRTERQGNEDGGNIMLRIRTGAHYGLRWGMFGFVAAVLTITSDRTLAAPYADIVVDANSGNVLHATNPDAQRHPASLTKIMTLYLLFEQLEAGKLKLDSQLKVSAEAAGQMPTKIGLKPGSTIAVEDAIKSIITRSANDIAVVVAEAIAGDEDDFAKLMTRKAQALGMSRTVYKNASGLPDNDQVTTARDQSTLGRAIQERFPKYYKYFSTRSFTFRGESISNHNHLLGRVEGVDGIKTGYIGASGYNLVTSVHRGNRYLVAVVMGGNSAGARDAKMRDLISTKIAQASTTRTAQMVAEAGYAPEAKAEAKVAKVEPKPEAKSEAKPERKVAVAIIDPKNESKDDVKAEAKPERKLALASAASIPARLTASEPRLAAGSTEPIKPVLVRTIAVRGTAPAAAPASLNTPPAAAQPAPVIAAKPEPAPVVAAKLEPKPEPKVEAKPEAKPEMKAEPKAEPKLEPKPEQRFALASATSVPARFVPPPAQAEPARVEPSRAEPVTTAAVAAPSPAAVAPARPRTAAAEPPPAPAPAVATPAPAAPTKPHVRSGWMIQVGAYQAEQEAKQRLTTVQSKASKVLNGADPFTETVDKGGTTFYRARFAGLDKDQAEAACKYLKRDGVDCVPIKN